jgi:cell division protein FtsN
MKRILVILYLLACHLFLKSQITMQTNLPQAIPLNSELNFDVKIKKGSSSNFAKYQMEVPKGATIKEVESRSGSFTFEDNVVKIIWVIAPAEPEIAISLKLVPGTVPGKKSFIQKYFYIENDNKKEVEMETVSVMFKDSAAAPSATSEAEFITLSPKAQPSQLTTTINAAEISTKNPEILKQQVIQLKRDSRDAFHVGESEKGKAQLKLAEAKKAITKAEAITDENEKKIALEKANSDKQKAEDDLEVASRVLILAKSLEDNANEIETINKSVNPASYSNQHVAANNSGGQASSIPANTGNMPVTSSGASSNKPNEPEKSSLVKKDSKTLVMETAAENGLVFKIQLGAFSKEPNKSDFKALGKVKVSQENGLYKVLLGNFNSKEEAFKQREQIIAKGFDGFVVSYQDGVRVK